MDYTTSKQRCLLELGLECMDDGSRGSCLKMVGLMLAGRSKQIPAACGRARKAFFLRCKASKVTSC